MIRSAKNDPFEDDGPGLRPVASPDEQTIRDLIDNLDTSADHSFLYAYDGVNIARRALVLLQLRAGSTRNRDARRCATNH